MKKIAPLIFWLSSLSVLFAQGPSDSFTRFFGGSRSDMANSVISTNDGGSIFIGNASSSDGDVIGLHGPWGWNYADFWVVKLNSSGTIQWQKCFGGSKNEVGYEIIQLSDGGYVIVGSSISNDGDVTLHYGSDSFRDAWIIKLDNSGNLLWQKTYGGYSDDYASCVTETADGSLLVGAILDTDYNGIVPVSYGGRDYWVLKLNSSGEMQWNNHYGGENNDNISSIKTTPDGGCILAGQSGSHYFDVVNSINPISGDIPDYWIVKLSPTGAIEWQKSYGGLQSDRATSMCLTNDGGYIIAGYTSSNNNGTVSNFHGGDTDGYIIKLNSAGNIEWQKCIGGTNGEYLNSILQTLDGAYIVCGVTNSTDGDLNGIIPGGKAWIIKLTSSGNISWQRHYMEASGNTFNDISQNSDGTYIAVGYRNYFQNYDNYDVFAVKLDAESLSNPEFDKIDITLYPNAVDDVLHIQSSNGEVFNEINLYDVQGKKVNSFFVENNSVDLRSLQKGFYFVEIKNELNQSIKKKILKN